jgi:hypothetical protein
LTPNKFKSLSIKESKEYFPEVEESMLMKSEKISNENSIESDWKKWKRFEGQCIQGEIYLIIVHLKILAY